MSSSGFNGTTSENILLSAKKEFLQHGFEGASLRKIATGAGVTTGALYRNFKDKAHLLETLIKPAYEEYIAMFEGAESSFFYLIQNEPEDTEKLFAIENFEKFTDYIYDNLEIFKLILSSSQHTSCGDFIHVLIEMEVESTYKFMKVFKERNPHAAKDISREELHLIYNAQFSTFFELILHDIPREKARAYMNTVFSFFSAGWKYIFGF